MDSSITFLHNCRRLILFASSAVSSAYPIIVIGSSGILIGRYVPLPYVPVGISNFRF